MIKFNPSFNFKIHQYDPNLLITINCNHPNCSRAKESYDIWGHEFLNYYKNVDIKFVTTWNNVTDPSKTILARQKQLEIPYRQMFYNNYKAYTYFLHTDKEWLFRTTEDVFVHRNNFMKFFEIMVNQEKNKTKPIFKAEMFFPSHWAHGGPGWIMNRPAVKVWTDNFKHIKNYFEFNDKVGDDVIIDEYIRIAHINPNDMHTNLFYGFPITEETEKKLTNKDWQSFEKCPPINTSQPLERAKVNDVAVWHSGTPSNFAVYNGKNIINNAPNNMFMIYKKTKYLEETTFCYE